MKVFVAGITGATGRRLVEQLLMGGHSVVAVARSAQLLPASFVEHPNLTLAIASILDMPENQLSDLLQGCDAIGCCLGHNLTRKGIWGEPRLLVRDAVQRLHTIAERQSAQGESKRLVLMGTNGVVNTGAGERAGLGDRLAISALRKVLPPQRDNELAAQYLLDRPESPVPWSIVRPDNLKDDEQVTPYRAFSRAQRGIVFGAAYTSRVNVAAFMMQLMTDDNVWQEWRGKMPVLYNEAALSKGTKTRSP